MTIKDNSIRRLAAMGKFELVHYSEASAWAQRHVDKVNKRTRATMMYRRVHEHMLMLTQRAGDMNDGVMLQCLEQVILSSINQLVNQSILQAGKLKAAGHKLLNEVRNRLEK